MKIQSEFANSEEAADSERKIREDLIAEIEKYKDKRFLIFFFDVPDPEDDTKIGAIAHGVASPEDLHRTISICQDQIMRSFLVGLLSPRPDKGDANKS
jgi:hypothetical protein